MKINYRRKNWKIKIRKPVPMRPNKIMPSELEPSRQEIKEEIKEIIKLVNHKEDTIHETN